jgi:hypothetical protein
MESALKNKKLFNAALNTYFSAIKTQPQRLKKSFSLLEKRVIATLKTTLPIVICQNDCRTDLTFLLLT